MSYLVVEFLRKNLVHIVVVGCLLGLLSWKSIENYTLQNKISDLEAKSLILEQSRQLAVATAKEEINQLTVQFNNTSAERDKKYAQQYKDLLIKHDATKLQLNSLHVTTNEIRDSVHSPETSRETIIKYTDNYREVFGECVTEYTKVAENSDKQVIKIHELNEEVEGIYQLLDSYREKNLKNQ